MLIPLYSPTLVLRVLNPSNSCFCGMFKGLKALAISTYCHDIQLLSQDFRSSVFILILCSKFAH